MGSIRPLVTITIILVAGAYLFVKINEGPVAPLPETADAWQSDMDVPPLASTVAAPSTVDSTAPSWPPADSSNTSTDDGAAGTLGSVPSAPPTADVAPATETLPAVPDLPDMPVATAESAVPSNQLDSIPDSLPQNVPVASYPDEPASRNEAVPSDPYGSTLPSATVPAVAGDNTATSTTVPETAPPAASASAAGATSLSPDAPLSQNPLRQTAPSAEVIDPYAPLASTPTPSTPAANAPVEPTFAASWPEIQTALQRGQLADAHQQLSKWYSDPSLTSAEAQTVETLLSQLAGTVVYSTQHQLGPAHVVRPGETLETIAQQYNVPWQLLAKINGIAAVDQVRPGQQIKVVPGPFSAVVDVQRSQLTLMVDGRYAGKFPVKVTDTAALKEGEWVVKGKPVTPYQATPTGNSRQLILTEADAMDASSATPLVIGSQPSSQPTRERIGADGQITSNAIPYVTVSPGDAEELADILSIGSRVTIRR